MKSSKVAMLVVQVITALTQHRLTQQFALLATIVQKLRTVWQKSAPLELGLILRVSRQHQVA